MKSGKKKDEVKFSWINVFRKWGQNLKDDVDPALTGAKWGVYGIHAIPTVHRELKEGKMRSERAFLSKGMALIVGGTELAGYWFASQHANALMDSDYLGYSVLGVPLLANGASWAGEAFKSAKKSEHGNVVMTRLRKSFEDTTPGEYQLTNNELVSRLTGQVAEGSHLLEKGVEGALGREQAKQYIMDVAGDVFEGLSADGRVGKKYQLSRSLATGPGPMKIRTGEDRYGRRYRDRKETQKLAKIVQQTVNANNGSAEIELFGNVTAVYTPQDGQVHYQVRPNKIWK